MLCMKKIQCCLDPDPPKKNADPGSGNQKATKIRNKSTSFSLENSTNIIEIKKYSTYFSDYKILIPQSLIFRQFKGIFVSGWYADPCNSLRIRSPWKLKLLFSISVRCNPYNNWQEEGQVTTKGKVEVPRCYIPDEWLDEYIWEEEAGTCFAWESRRGSARASRTRGRCGSCAWSTRKPAQS